ncbi:Uncharacterized protein dnm_049030 [Desulfonema magnum]|uniref:Uncharacterized protein n=1 Tax=Desulfonema magnum TaxID=45655 RepID=A0A975GPC1_9BACT|nr:Uncharacterized protein dnm_049030 [Desulfonema magnum]
MFFIPSGASCLISQSPGSKLPNSSGSDWQIRTIYVSPEDLSILREQAA